MMFTTTSKKACVAATLTAVAGISMDCNGIQCGIARTDPDDENAPPVLSFANQAHGGLVYLSALTGTLASKLGGILMLVDDTPPVQAGPVEDDLDAASDVDGDGHVSEQEASLANEIIAAHEAEQAAATEEVIFGGAEDGADAEPPVDDLVAVQVPSGANDGAEGESGDDTSGETATTEGGSKPKRFRPKKLAKKLSSVLTLGSRGSSSKSTGAADDGAASEPTV